MVLIPQLTQRFFKFIKKKHDPILCYLKKTYFKYNNIRKLKVKRGKGYTFANINQRKAGVTYLISDSIDFEVKKISNTERDIIY